MIYTLATSALLTSLFTSGILPLGFTLFQCTDCSIFFQFVHPLLDRSIPEGANFVTPAFLAFPRSPPNRRITQMHSRKSPFAKDPKRTPQTSTRIRRPFRASNSEDTKMPATAQSCLSLEESRFLHSIIVKLIIAVTFFFNVILKL